MPSEGVTNATEEGKDPVMREGGTGNDRDPDPEHQNETRAEGAHQGRPSASLNAEDHASNVSTTEDPPPSATQSRHGDLLDRGASTTGSSRHRRPTHVGEPLEQWELDEMETLLGDLCGTLGPCCLLRRELLCRLMYYAVIYPTRFLEGEDASNK